jgi:hypothetical protein
MTSVTVSRKRFRPTRNLSRFGNAVNALQRSILYSLNHVTPGPSQFKNILRASLSTAVAHFALQNICEMVARSANRHFQK